MHMFCELLKTPSIDRFPDLGIHCTEVLELKLRPQESLAEKQRVCQGPTCLLERGTRGLSWTLALPATDLVSLSSVESHFPCV